VIAARRVFWVAALAGIIVFGSLMGAMFIGQQYRVRVTRRSGRRRDRSAAPVMVIAAPRSRSSKRGARFTLAGLRVRDAGLRDDVRSGMRQRIVVALGYALVGAGSSSPARQRRTR
jgi:hypothetical protein